jgi:predicted CoA-binding protein
MPDFIAQILEQYKTLAVVGLSPKTTCPAMGSLNTQEHGYHIIPAPHESEVLGESYPLTRRRSRPTEVVVIFRRPICA